MYAQQKFKLTYELPARTEGFEWNELESGARHGRFYGEALV